MNVLVLNAGSSSLKFQLIATDRDAIAANKDVRLCRGQIDRFGGEEIGRASCRERVWTAVGHGRRKTKTATSGRARVSSTWRTMRATRDSPIREWACAGPVPG